MELHKNLPAALLDSLEHAGGFNRNTFEEAHINPAQVTSIRLNPGKPFAANNPLFDTDENVTWCADGRYLKQRPSFTFDPMLHGGAYYVQEASSMFLWHALEHTVGKNTSGLKVLDLCAAPGGKSTLLASYFKDALVVANEVIKPRANTLVENITKWGTDNVVVTCNDPSHFARLPNFFDVIVVDAPCSGSGLFRKDPAAIDEWSEDNVALCSQRQQRILADIYSALKKDGILIYSTCSYSKLEDEDILDWMAKDLQVTSCRLPIADDWGIVETVSGNGAYGYRFYPDKIKGEGFFIAVFKKSDGSVSHDYPLSLTAVTKNEAAIAANWTKKNADLFYFKQKENIIAIPSIFNHDIALLQKHLYLRKAGINIGVIKGKDIVPDHELALSLLLEETIPRIELNYADAIQYLKKREVVLENAEKGWAVITYYGLPLGWVKVLHNRVNNYYPIEWRILKD